MKTQPILVMCVVALLIVVCLLIVIYCLPVHICPIPTPRQMQVMLNDAGYTDNDGNPLEVDGRFGSKSMETWLKSAIDAEIAQCNQF